MNIAEKILTAVGIITDAAVQKAGYDRTVVATIAAVDDLETKTYTVQYGDAQHTAKGNAEYIVGDQVYVIIPGEDTLDWQISALAQGVLIGNTWIDEKEIPKDNLIEAEIWNDNSLDLDGVYTQWIVSEIKEKLKLYVKAAFVVRKDLLKLNSLPEYKIIFTFNNGLQKVKSVNDMIGNPFQIQTHEQLFRFEFTQEEADAINEVVSITFDSAGAGTDVYIKTDGSFAIYGTYSPDLGSAYPIECKIFRWETNNGTPPTKQGSPLLVTDNLITDLGTSATKKYAFSAQLTQGSVDLLEANTEYFWKIEVFDWNTLTWQWIAKSLDKEIFLSSSSTIYPITRFKCWVTRNGISYTSCIVQIQDSTKQNIEIIPECGVGDNPKYYVTLSGDPEVSQWAIQGVLQEGLIVDPVYERALNSPVKLMDCTEITLDANLITSPIKIYARKSQDPNPSYSFGEITLANIGRESSNIEVLNIATYMYNLGGELVGVAPRPLEAKFYDPQGNPVESGVKWTWIFPPSENTLLIDNRIEEFTEGASQGNTCTFGLQPYYDIAKTNNAIEVHAEYEGVTYIHTATIGILRTGEPGTNGTDVICKIGVIHGVDKRKTGAESPSWDFNENAEDYPIYEQVSTETISINEDKIDQANGLKFSLHLENVMNGTSILDNATVTWFKWSDANQESTTTWVAGKDIICAKAVIAETDDSPEKTYYAYLPIAKYTNTKLRETSGFAHVIYQPNGTNPSYSIAAFESENGSKPISSIQANYSQYWASLNSPLPVPVSNFSLVDNYETDLLKPVSYRNIILTFTLDNGGGTVTLPILFRYNAYGLAQDNAWDGSSVTLADGAVMAPMAGFGSKNDQNQFSGVLLGAVSPTNTDGSTLSRRGIFGEYHGEETFFLNSDDGSATFGKKGEGQIIIDPSQNEAIIKSGNYNEGQSGMQINLSEPSIKWGNGRFEVNEDGIATISGATFSNIANATDSKGNPLAQKIEIFWAAQEKGLSAPVSGWLPTQPTINLDTNDLWQKIVYTYFGGGTETSIVNTTANSYTLSLSQDTDVIAKTGTGEFVSAMPVIEATLWCGATQIAFPLDNSSQRYRIELDCTKANGDSISLKEENPEEDANYRVSLSEDKKTLTLTFLTLPVEFDSGTITFYAPGISAATSKAFTLRTVTSEVDYDLIVQSVVNTTTESKNVAIQVLKTTKSGNTTLSSKGTEPILIKVNGAPLGSGEEDWTIIIEQDSNDVEVVLESETITGLVWDREMIEVVHDGGEGRGIIAQNPCIYYFNEPETAQALTDFIASLSPPQDNIINHPETTPSTEQWYRVNGGVEIPAVINKKKVFAAQCTEIIYSDDNDEELDNNPREYTAVTLVQSIANLTRWASDNDETLIDGGHIYAKSINAGAMATDSLRSLNYKANESDKLEDENSIVIDENNGKIEDYYATNSPIPNANPPFAAQGTYFDLEKGCIHSQQFAITDTGSAYFAGDLSVSNSNANYSWKFSANEGLFMYKQKNSTSETLFSIDGDDLFINASQGYISGWTINESSLQSTVQDAEGEDKTLTLYGANSNARWGEEFLGITAGAQTNISTNQQFADQDIDLIFSTSTTRHTLNYISQKEEMEVNYSAPYVDELSISKLKIYQETQPGLATGQATTAELSFSCSGPTFNFEPAEGGIVIDFNAKDSNYSGWGISVSQYYMDGFRTAMDRSDKTICPLCLEIYNPNNIGKGFYYYLASGQYSASDIVSNIKNKRSFSISFGSQVKISGTYSYGYSDWNCYYDISLSGLPSDVLTSGQPYVAILHFYYDSSKNLFPDLSSSTTPTITYTLTPGNTSFTTSFSLLNNDFSNRIHNNSPSYVGSNPPTFSNSTPGSYNLSVSYPSAWYGSSSIFTTKPNSSVTGDYSVALSGGSINSQNDASVQCTVSLGSNNKTAQFKVNRKNLQSYSDTSMTVLKAHLLAWNHQKLRGHTPSYPKITVATAKPKVTIYQTSDRVFKVENITNNNIITPSWNMDNATASIRIDYPSTLPTQIKTVFDMQGMWLGQTYPFQITKSGTLMSTKITTPELFAADITIDADLANNRAKILTFKNTHGIFVLYYDHNSKTLVVQQGQT